jgi:dihydrofolate synthase / folylpolyglutamate synthase
MSATPHTVDDWQLYIGRERPSDVTRGLAPVSAVARELGIARPARHNIVIAGTNGKGSTAVFSEALLRDAGLRVGTTLSPHLVCFNERIRIDGRPASDELICAALAAVDAARGDASLSYFEYATLAALWVFVREGVDAAVLEVGLGGRLDAVNVVDGQVTVITSIGLDHQALLGDDRESIGAEKAGILRPRVPLVYGEIDMPVSIAATAARLDAPVTQLGRDYNARMGTGDWCYTGAAGSFDALALPRVAIQNAATALQAVQLLRPDLSFDAARIDAATRIAHIPGRFQSLDVFGRTFVLDVAHNPHAAAFLSQQLMARPCGGRTVAVAGFLRDKDVVGIVRALVAAVERFWFVDTHGERGQAAAAVAMRAVGLCDGVPAPTLDEAIAAAVQHTEPGDRILVAGSFDVVQRAIEKLRPVERAA